MFETKSLLYELEKYNQWVVWKDKKILLNPRDGTNASITNPTTWGSYEEAAVAFEEHDYSGIGFVVTDDDPICAIDLDNCIDPETGKIEQWALQIASDLWSYTEVSPSGMGMHIFIKGTKPGDKCRKKIEEGRVELYDSKHFLTITENVLQGTPVEERQDELDALYNSVFPEKPTNESKNAGTEEHVHSGGGKDLSDNELLSKARRAKNGAKFTSLYDERGAKGYASESEADGALLSYLAFWTGKDAERMERLMWESGRVRDKWYKNRSYIPRTVEGAIQTCKRVYNPEEYKKKNKKSVQVKIEQLTHWRLNYSWPGRSGTSDKDVYYALLSLASEYGMNHEEGVTVKGSNRDLALRAGISRPATVRDALKRLQSHSFVRVLNKGTKKFASTYLLTLDPQEGCAKASHIICDYNYGTVLRGKVRNPSRLVSSIGKRAEQILDFAHEMERIVTLEEIAELLGMRKRDVRNRYIKTLLAEPSLLIETEEGYYTPDDLVERLEQHMEQSGQNTAYKLQYERYEMEREAFQIADEENRQRVERSMHHRDNQSEEEFSNAVSLSETSEMECVNG